MGREMKVEKASLCFVRNESNLYLMGAVNSNTQAILKFSFWASYYNALSIALTKAPDRTKVNSEHHHRL
jgi:hypothetical protein